MTTALLSDNEIASRLAALAIPETGVVTAQGTAVPAVPPSSVDTAVPDFVHIRPLADATKSFIDVVENPGNRVTLGLPTIDVLTRGFGPRELVIVVGFAHSGKTQLINAMILNNPQRRILYFSLDDPAEMIVVKLLCMHSGIAADVLEQRVRNHDPAVHKLLADAEILFPNLLIVDQPLGFGQIVDAIAEATELWGAPPECVVIDYLALIPSSDGNAEGSNTVISKAQELKRLVKSLEYPVICVHQGTRSQCGPGKPVTLTSLAFGGEQEATMVLGVRRKREDDDADEADRRYNANTITLHLVKNKRPPSKRTPYEGIDFFMDPDTGMIRPIRDGELRSGPRPSDVAREVRTTSAPVVDAGQTRLLEETFGRVTTLNEEPF